MTTALDGLPVNAQTPVTAEPSYSMRIADIGHGSTVAPPYDDGYTLVIPDVGRGGQMAHTATKVAVSIPRPLYQAVERIRKASGKSRSAVIQAALRYWLDHQAQAALVREYEAGYRRKPEGRREIEAAEAAAVRLLSTEDW